MVFNADHFTRDLVVVQLVLWAQKGLQYTTGAQTTIWCDYFPAETPQNRSLKLLHTLGVDPHFLTHLETYLTEQFEPDEPTDGQTLVNGI